MRGAQVACAKVLAAARPGPMRIKTIHYPIKSIQYLPKCSSIDDDREQGLLAHRVCSLSLLLFYI